MRYALNAALCFLALLSVFLALPALAQEPTPAPVAATGVFLSAFMQYALPPLTVTLAGLLGLVLTKLSQFLHAKAEGSKVGTVLVQGSDFVTTAVAHVISGLAKDVRDALANDGKLDDAERAALKAKAIALIKAELPIGLKTAMGVVLQGGLDTWLSGKAEAAIDAATGSPQPAPSGP